jgi:hypothetical protein
LDIVAEGYQNMEAQQTALHPSAFEQPRGYHGDQSMQRGVGQGVLGDSLIKQTRIPSKAIDIVAATCVGKAGKLLARLERTRKTQLRFISCRTYR